MQELFEGVFISNGDIYTKNLVPGQRVYSEKVVVLENTEYRRWDPYRSKLAAAIKKGLEVFPFSSATDVLYLGASTGTTVSHLSDICVDGTIFAVEISPKMMEKLLELSSRRENIVPILADARMPETYEDIGSVDVVYQDLAQPDQERIFVMNCRKCLKQGGYGMLCLKTQSIDVTVPSEEVLRQALSSLSEQMEILQYVDLSPFDKEHYFILTRR